MNPFKLESKFKPVTEQIDALDDLVQGLNRGDPSQVLLGVTGSGKTFTLANVIKEVNRPTLVISHNKTLAAQLYSEFREFFPRNAVEYFVSYYDYYQPEAYIPSTDVYIEKDASINDRLDRLRLAATAALSMRRDVIIVASVSCIYNIGSPEDYQNFLLYLEKGQAVDRDTVLRRLVDMQYERDDINFVRGKMRVRGDVLEVFPAYRQDALRVEFFGDEIERILQIDPVTGNVLEDLARIGIYPAKHFMISRPQIEKAMEEIRQEMTGRVRELNRAGKVVEAHRLETRTKYDLDMLNEMGYCNGIENYSRVLSGRAPGSRPCSLMDYFPKDFLTIIDESHVTVPQIGGMYAGDRSRKEMLVEHGFRLPSCLDNRPLRFEEFKQVIGQVIYVSATPGEYERKDAEGRIIEQIIRPTGIVDPPIEVRPTAGQIEDFVAEVRARVKKNERVLATTLTKRMSEDLARYLEERGLKVKYLHSDIKTIERTKILHDLRMKKFDCLIGVNLLREGLDLPEVSLVVIFDANKEGFLRSQTSLIQTSGRAARHVEGRVIMYADSVSAAMRLTMDECDRRRKIQLQYNRDHNITPQPIIKSVLQGIEQYAHNDAERIVLDVVGQAEEEYGLSSLIAEMEREMEQAARNLEFEKAAALRDKIAEMKSIEIKDIGSLNASLSKAPAFAEPAKRRSRSKSG